MEWIVLAPTLTNSVSPPLPCHPPPKHPAGRSTRWASCSASARRRWSTLLIFRAAACMWLTCRRQVLACWLCGAPLRRCELPSRHAPCSVLHGDQGCFRWMGM
eukprot:366092-Chlamydomonas_euryale.AAC.15